jgi:hypothetical protein
MIDVYVVQSERGGDAKVFNKQSVELLAEMGVITHVTTGDTADQYGNVRIHTYRKAD